MKNPETADADTAVPFIGKHNKSPRFKCNGEVRECQEWLQKEGFTSERESYAPDPRVWFEVVKPLEACGNGDDLPTLRRGVWKNKRTMPSTSSVRILFESKNGDTQYICVGYDPDGVNAIMAWMGNIKKV